MQNMMRRGGAKKGGVPKPQPPSPPSILENTIVEPEPVVEPVVEEPEPVVEPVVEEPKTSEILVNLEIVD